MIQTVDFFPAMLDDPFEFGQVAAANSLSDIYAMGGQPKLAMNIVGFPSCLETEIIAEILRGGYTKVKEADAIIAGGHSIEDEEPKYGLSVCGFARPDKILTNSSAKAGDILILTKPLGTGILSAAASADLLSPEEHKQMVECMSQLNKTACEIMLKHKANACTDITGFGFLGHTMEMARGSNKTIQIRSSNIPYFEKALSLAKEGIIPGGAYRNADYIKKDLSIQSGVSREMLDIMHDPQTSGGLLIAVPENSAIKLQSALKDNIECAEIVGQIINKQESYLAIS